MNLADKSVVELHALIAEARSGAPGEKENTALIEACEHELGVRGGWIVAD